jgi:hypothetical protein
MTGIDHGPFLTDWSGMAHYMHYQGRAVEVYGFTPSGQAVPRLYPGDQGEAVGDYAVVNERAVEWDGRAWVPSAWTNFSVSKKAAS